MTVTLLVQDGDAEAVTFTVSPLAELGAALHVLAEPGHHGGLLAWADRVRAAMGADLLAEHDSLVFLWRSYRANFLLPMKPGRVLDLEQELDEIDDMSVEAFVDEAVQPLRGGGPQHRVVSVLEDQAARERVRTYARSRGAAVEAAVEDLFADPQGFRFRLRELLEGCWERFFGDEWAQLRPTLVADAQERSDLARTHGVYSMFDALAPGVLPDPDAHRVVIDKVHHGKIDVARDGLQLVPSVFGWPHVLVRDGPEWPPSLQYPVRGARRPAARMRTVEKRLEALADPARLRICRSIVREGRSTQELSEIWGMTPPTVSRHLKVLREAGLVTTQRQGHFVLYRLDLDAAARLGPDLLEALLR